MHNTPLATSEPARSTEVTARRIIQISRFAAQRPRRSGAGETRYWVWLGWQIASAYAEWLRKGSTNLQGHDQPQAVFDLLEQIWSQDANSFRQEVFANRDDLRDIRDRVLGQTRHCAREKNIAWSLRQSCVGRDDRDDDRGNPA